MMIHPRTVIDGCRLWRAVAATVIAVAGAAGVSTAAANARVVAHVGGSTVSVSTNPAGHPVFYWTADTSPSSDYHSEVVPTTVTIQQQPAVSQVGNVSVIAAWGTDDSLQVYSQQIGATCWSQEQVAPAGSTYGVPDITEVANAAVITAAGPNRTIDAYYQPTGSLGCYKLLFGHPPSAQGWEVQIVSNAPGAPTSGYGWPSIAQVGDSTVIASAGPNGSLWKFSQPIGASGWAAEQVAAYSTQGNPSVAAVTTGGVTYTEIAADGQSNTYVYKQAVGTSGPHSWGIYIVNSGLVWEPSIAQVGNAVVVTEIVGELVGPGPGQQVLHAWELFATPAAAMTDGWSQTFVTNWGGLGPGVFDPPGVLASTSSSTTVAEALGNGTTNTVRYTINVG